MKTFHTVAIVLGIANIAIGIEAGDMGRILVFCVLLLGLIFTRRWVDD